MASAVAPSPAIAVATSVERLTSRKQTSETVSATSAARPLLLRRKASKLLPANFPEARDLVRVRREPHVLRVRVVHGQRIQRHGVRLLGDLQQRIRSEEHTSELQSRLHLVCRL